MKKWIFLTTAVILLGVILFFYVSFNGNFVTKMVAKGKVQDFVEEMFEGHNKQLIDSGYNFKDGQYYFHYEIYIDAVPVSYSFSLGGPVILNDAIDGYLHFESANEKLEGAFANAASSWLKEQLSEIPFDEISYSVSIPKGLYKDEISWQPQVDEKLMPSIWFEVKDENQTEAEFLQQAEQIRQFLNEHNVTYSEARVAVTREYDNTDGAKEGYAPIYYEGLYYTYFTPKTEKLLVE